MKKTVHIIYSIVLTLSLTVTGVLLILACVGIYNSGSRPFTPESVAAAFSYIAVPVYICLGLLFGGFVLELTLPLPPKKHTAVRQDAALLEKLRAKLSGENCDPALAKSIRREQHIRTLHRSITAVLLVAGSIVFLCYGTNPANFHQTEITESMEKAMYILLPCMALPFGYSVFAAYRCRASVKKETALVKQAIAGGSVKPAQETPAKASLPWLRYALLVFAVGILIYGYFAGGTNDVLTKAINICTECVGLG